MKICRTVISIAANLFLIFYCPIQGGINQERLEYDSEVISESILNTHTISNRSGANILMGATMLGPIGALFAYVGAKIGFKLKAKKYIQKISTGTRKTWNSDSVSIDTILTFALLYFAFQADNDHWRVHNEECIRNIIGLFPYQSTNANKTVSNQNLIEADFIENLSYLINYKDIDERFLKFIRAEEARERHPISKEAREEEEERIKQERKNFINNRKAEFSENFNARKTRFFSIVNSPHNIPIIEESSPVKELSYGIARSIDKIILFAEKHYLKITLGVLGLLYVKYLRSKKK